MWALIRDAEQQPVWSERGAWDEFYSAVAAAVRGVAPLLVDPQDAVDVLGILEAVRTNAKEPCVIHF